MNQKLEKKIRRLDELIVENHRNDGELFAQLNRAQIELGIVDKGRPFCPFLRPHFMMREQYARIANAAETLAAVFERLTHAALENPEVMAELGVTEREERLARIHPGYRGICNSSRLDAFLHADEFKFLEYNAETPAGIIDQMQIGKLMDMIPEVADFLAGLEHWRPKPQEKLLSALVADYREFGGLREKPNIAIVDWKDVGTITEFRVLAEYFESMGHRTRIIDPFDLEYDGKTLTAGDFVIDIFYKRVLIHEFLEKFDDDNPLIEAYSNGHIFMANSFRTKIPHKKSSFAVATDRRFAHVFTAEQLRMIDLHLPWTRRLAEGKTEFHGTEIDLVEHLRRNRSDFILKPNDDYGGSGIVFGWESSASEWDSALDTALVESFVVQERVAVEKMTIPAYENEIVLRNWLIDFDPFLFRGRVEGGLCRLSGSSLVNVARGGGETALVVVEK